MKSEILSDRVIILASQSPRRIALLREAGIAFEAVTPRHAEPDLADWPLGPAAFAESAAYFKARSVAEDHPDRIVLGADTVVALGGVIFGKPADAADARRILAALAGTTQQVITGVALYRHAARRRLIRHAVTHVTMRPMTDAELDEYIAGGEWEGKAGAYGIQGTADRFVERTEGSFSNVVGLPVELVVEMLGDLGDRGPGT